MNLLPLLFAAVVALAPLVDKEGRPVVVASSIEDGLRHALVAHHLDAETIELYDANDEYTAAAYGKPAPISDHLCRGRAIVLRYEETHWSDDVDELSFAMPRTKNGTCDPERRFTFNPHLSNDDLFAILAAVAPLMTNDHRITVFELQFPTSATLSISSFKSSMEVRVDKGPNGWRIAKTR